MRNKARVLWCLAACLLAPSAQAGQVELYGASVRAAGLAGGGWALEDEAAAVASLPAALGLSSRDSFRLHYLGGHVWLDEVDGFSHYDADASAAPSVSTQPHILAADFAKGIGPWVRVGAQLSLSLPWIYSHETKDPWAPYSMRWQNRISRSLGNVGASFRLPVRGVDPEQGAFKGGLWFGASLSVRPRGIIDVDLDLSGVASADGGAVEATLSEVILAAEYVLRPQLSLLLDLGCAKEALEGLRIGFLYAPESTTDISPIRLDVAVLGLGEVNAVFALVDRLQAQVALGLTDFYDPHELRFSLALERPRFALSADVRLSLWSQIAVSYGRVVDTDESELAVEFGTGSVETFPVISGRFLDDGTFRDTVEATVGGEGRIALGGKVPAGTELRLRGGFRYMQGAVVPSEGPMATLDGDALTGSIGLGLLLPLQKTRERLGPLSVDWALQATRLLPQDLPKTAEGLAGLRDLPGEWSSDASWTGGSVLLSGVSVGLGF